MSNNNISRRDLLQSTAATAAAVTIASLNTNFAWAAGSDTIRVGLIGCGGRGTGAARDALNGGENVEIIALGDLFKDRLDGCRKNLNEDKELTEKVKVTDDTCFTGFDAYQKVIASDVNYVVLATPPGFRPMHLKAAIDAGKHVFTEKPIAVDPAGCRLVMEAGDIAKEKGLGIVAGTQRRHQAEYIETIKRIKDGAIGDVVAGYCYWNQGGLWKKDRKPEWTDMEWQIRNWLYFAWLSGDHIVEQHVHNIDVMNWVIGEHPISAYGMGGRQVRTEEVYGHIYDHFTIEFQYPSGARVTSMCRQQEGTATQVGEFAIGTKGTSNCANVIKGENDWKYKKSEGQKPPYVQEHIDLIASIRAGNPLNEARQVAESTLTAIMGRMSAYTGKKIEWDQALKSELNLMPAKLEMGPIAVPAVPMPGKEQVV